MNEPVPYTSTHDKSNRKQLLLRIVCALLTIITLISLCYADYVMKRNIQLTDMLDLEIEKIIKKELRSISTELSVASKCFGKERYEACLTEIKTSCTVIERIASLSKSGRFYGIAEYTDILSVKADFLAENDIPKFKGMCLEIEKINSELYNKPMEEASYLWGAQKLILLS